MNITLCWEQKHPLTFSVYISVENVSIYTKFTGYVCEELGIPLKSMLNIHNYADSQTFYQIFIFYSDSVKSIIYKHVNMTSELRHR